MSKPKARLMLVITLAGLGAVFACLAAPVLRPPATTFAVLSILSWMAAVYLAAGR